MKRNKLPTHKIDDQMKRHSAITAIDAEHQQEFFTIFYYFTGAVNLPDYFLYITLNRESAIVPTTISVFLFIIQGNANT